MSQSEPPSERAAIVRALEVKRNAVWGFALAIVVTAGVFFFFAVVPGTHLPFFLFVFLAVVLASALGGLITTLLTIRTAVKFARE